MLCFCCSDGGVLSSVVKSITKKVGAVPTASANTSLREDDDESLEESMKKVRHFSFLFFRRALNFVLSILFGRLCYLSVLSHCSGSGRRESSEVSRSAVGSRDCSLKGEADGNRTKATEIWARLPRESSAVASVGRLSSCMPLASDAFCS